MSIREDVLDAPGCYVLALIVGKNLEVRTRSLFFQIPRGVYFYVGSARGAGGVKARVFRHMLRQRRRHWHIDHLLGAGEVFVSGFYAIPSQKEWDCEVEVARALSMALKPISGFGCTDKVKDVSHLFECNHSLEECLAIVYELLTEKVREPWWFQNI